MILLWDFTGGSGAFIVRAMTDAMDDCETEIERDNVKKNKIFGIEYEDGAFGLSSTNMLIHGDENSNVVQASMFDMSEWIQDKNINIIRRTMLQKSFVILNTQKHGIQKRRNIHLKVTYEDEWLAEAYIETDYSTLSKKYFQLMINSYVSYLVKKGYVYED